MQPHTLRPDPFDPATGGLLQVRPQAPHHEHASLVGGPASRPPPRTRCRRLPPPLTRAVRWSHRARPQGVDPATQAAAAAPAPASLAREVAAFRAAAAATPPPRFSVHRLLLADSGTLLLCRWDARPARVCL